MDFESLPNDNLSTELWNIYIKDKVISNRNNLFHFYSPWLKKIVSGFYLKNGSAQIHWDDCMQNAAIALIQSIERYDMSQGVPFEGYAYVRIKGALLNTYNKENLNAQNGERDDQEKTELDFELEQENIDFNSFIDSVINVAFSQLLNVAAHRVSDTSIDPLELQILYYEERAVIAAINKLDENLRFIVSSHYQHFMSFQQIAISLGLSKTRVSQLHLEALKKLRTFYEAG